MSYSPTVYCASIVTPRERAERRSSFCHIDDTPVDTGRRACWARLIQKVYEVDPLECTRCGGTLRIIAFIDDGDVIERILKHLDRWDPTPETITSSGPDPPIPKGETLPLTYHPVPDIA